MVFLYAVHAHRNSFKTVVWQDQKSASGEVPELQGAGEHVDSAHEGAMIKVSVLVSLTKTPMLMMSSSSPAGYCW
jgi:hypothetical protein